MLYDPVLFCHNSTHADLPECMNITVQDSFRRQELSDYGSEQLLTKNACIHSCNHMDIDMTTISKIVLQT